MDRIALWLQFFAALGLLLSVRSTAEQPQQCSSDQSAFGPRFHVPDSGVHLANIKDVILALGYTHTDNPADANLIWAWKDPFGENKDDPKRHAVYQQLRRLTWHQLVNQMPGLGYMASKQELGKLSHSIRAIPRTFQLPSQYEEWQEFIKTDPRGGSMEWIEKLETHRGIRIIPGTSDPSFAEAKGKLVQQLVRPYLIDGRLWDIGIYVAITQLEPLTAYVYTGSALLRFCSKHYERNITNDTDTSTYVIYGLEDFTPGPDIPVLQPHYAEAFADTEMGSSMSLAALRGYLSSQGVNTTKWWLDVQSVIVQVLHAVTPKMEHVRSYYYPEQRSNFFTLIRFDFMLDENTDSYLIEVNMSPGLYKPGIDLKHQLLSRKLIHDILCLKGLGPAGRFNQFTTKELQPLRFHTDATAVGEASCGGDCSTADECNTKPECKLCKPCKSQWQMAVLSNFMAEHQNAHAFMRIHPPHRQLATHMAETGVEAESFLNADERPDDVLLKMWIEKKCEQDFRWC